MYIASTYRSSSKENAPSSVTPDTKITFIEGWSIGDIAEYLDNNTRHDPAHIVGKKEFIEAQENFNASLYPLLASRPKNADLEGFVFPDTYLIPPTAPTSTTISAIILKKALDNFTKKFTPEMEQQAKSAGRSVYEIITLASIVEKETGSGMEEKKIVAGIFYNRLSIGMALESDATVNYVSGKNLASPSIKDTKLDSPYNTYKYKGLPPGPICNPSLNSIMAVLYPTETDNMYFLHDQKNGKAYYSVTYEGHLSNKQKYLGK